MDNEHKFVKIYYRIFIEIAGTVNISFRLFDKIRKTYNTLSQTYILKFLSSAIELTFCAIHRIQFSSYPLLLGEKKR